MAESETVSARFQELRRGLERRGVKSSWGKLRVVALDEKELTVTLETSNYMFYQQFKTSKLVLTLFDLLERKDLSLGHEERTGIQELRHSLEREKQRREEDRLAREEARRREEDSRRRREQADRRAKERATKRAEERRQRRERETLLRELVTSIGFPMEEGRKEIADLSRQIDEAASLPLAFRLAVQHVLYGRPERACPILDAAATMHRQGGVETAGLKAASRESVEVTDPDRIPADADAGLQAAACLFAVERGDIGRAYLSSARALRQLYMTLFQRLEWPLGDDARPAADTATRSLFNVRLKKQLLKDSTAFGENYLEEVKIGADPAAEAEAHLNLCLSYVCRGLHDEVAAAGKRASELLASASVAAEGIDLPRLKALSDLMDAWRLLLLDEDPSGALEATLQVFRNWPRIADERSIWEIFVYGTDPHVRGRLLLPFLGTLADRLTADGLSGVDLIRSFGAALKDGSVAGETRD